MVPPMGVAMRLVLVLVLMLWPLAGAAGPWPREAGGHFLSVSATGKTGSVWVERGLSRGQWLVFEGRADRNGSWSGALRLHKAMVDRGGWKLAWALGLAVEMPQTDIVIDLPPVVWPGRAEVTVRIEPTVAVQAGVSLGKGLARGWLALDVMAEAGSGGYRLKADATWGYRPRERWTLMVQAHAGLGRGRPALALAPSVVWQVRRGVKLQAGVHHDLRGRKSVAKLATWLEF